MAIPLIYLKGDPFQRGLSYGELARDQIRLVLEEYKILFEKEANLSWEVAQEKAMQFNSVIHENCPDLVEEIDGIAKGCDMDYVDILALNCHSEILFPHANCASTTIGMPPEASGNGRTYLAQNSNWCSLAQGTLVVLEIEQDPYPNLLLLTEAGLIGGHGINEHGLAIGHNGLPVKQPSIGLPVPFLLRQAFNEETVSSCIEKIASFPKALGSCFTFASSRGTVLAMECDAEGMEMLLCNGKPLCHTNHWLSPVFQASFKNERHPIKSTYARLDWANRLTQEKDVKMAKKTLFQILSHHSELPDCQCREGKLGLPSYLTSSAICSMVIDVTQKIIWINGKTNTSGITGYRFEK